MSNEICHTVYFTLDDDSSKAIDHLVSQCQKYLNDHPGLVYFGVGRLVPDLDRAVNVRDFHVSLHTVFADRAAHDAYQIAPRHLEFIENNKASWKQVRVFDSELSG